MADFSWLSPYADVLGIASAIGAGFAWFKARGHSKEAEKSLDIIRNYKKVETFTEADKKIEVIRSNIRGTRPGSSVQRKYRNSEELLYEISNSIPTTYQSLINQVKDIEELIRRQADQNTPFAQQDEYDVIEKLYVVKSQIKEIMENLRQGT
jgi:hypothetical protein